MEQWKDVLGFEGYYEVSSLGNIRRSIKDNAHDGTYPGRVLKQEYIKGYKRVVFCVQNKKKRMLVHRVVAEAFLPNDKELRTVNHKNGIKHDNRLTNLEWASYSENMLHAVERGLRWDVGSKHPKAKLTENDIEPIRQRVLKGDAKVDVAKSYGVSAVLIGLICRGKIWKKTNPLPYSP